MSKLGLTLAILAAGLLGGAVGEWARGTEARAAVRDAAHYQISAYGYTRADGQAVTGVYILNLETGELVEMDSFKAGRTVIKLGK